MNWAINVFICVYHKNLWLILIYGMFMLFIEHILIKIFTFKYLQNVALLFIFCATNSHFCEMLTTRDGETKWYTMVFLLYVSWTCINVVILQDILELTNNSSTTLRPQPFYCSYLDCILSFITIPCFVF